MGAHSTRLHHPPLLPLAVALLLGACGSKATGGETGGETTQGADLGTGGEVTCADVTFADTDGEPTGYEQCSDGAVYRKEAVACHPRPATGETPCAGPTWAADDCEADADCQAFSGNGSCYFADVDGQSCYCHYDCQTDADCGPGAICRCAADEDGWRAVNQCVPAYTCTTDADCPGAERCLLRTLKGGGCPGQVGTVAACTSPEDECATQSDCPGPSGTGTDCRYDPQQARFVCENDTGCPE